MCVCVYVCVYVCMCACVCMCAYTYVCVYFFDTYKYTHTHTHTYTRTPTHRTVGQAHEVADEHGGHGHERVLAQAAHRHGHGALQDAHKVLCVERHAGEHHGRAYPGRDAVVPQPRHACGPEQPQEHSEPDPQREHAGELVGQLLDRLRAGEQGGHGLLGFQAAHALRSGDGGLLCVRAAPLEAQAARAGAARQRRGVGAPVCRLKLPERRDARAVRGAGERRAGCNEGRRQCASERAAAQAPSTSVPATAPPTAGPRLVCASADRRALPVRRAMQAPRRRGRVVPRAAPPPCHAPQRWPNPPQPRRGAIDRRHRGPTTEQGVEYVDD